MRRLIIIILFFILPLTVKGWFVWDLYQIYDDIDREVLLKSGYRMYEFKAISTTPGGTSYISKHDVYYDWFRAHLILSESTLEREQKLEIGDYLRVNYSPFVFKKKINGISYSFSTPYFGKISFALSRPSSPGTRGSEVEENQSSIIMGADYQNKFERINLKYIEFKDFELGFSFANLHNENYDNPESGIFRLNVDKEISPTIYLMIADSDTSDGNGGQIFEIKYICYDGSGNVLKEVYFHTPGTSTDPDNEDDYLYFNNGGIDGDHRFADLDWQIIYAFPVPLNTKKVFLIIKTGGNERVVKISADNINYYTIPDSILPVNDYCNIILTETGAEYDNSITLGTTSTYDDTASPMAISFNLAQVLSEDVYSVSGNTAFGVNWKTFLIFPLAGEFFIEGRYAHSIERRVYYTEKKNIEGNAFQIKLSKEITFPFGLFESGIKYWCIDNKFYTGFSVDSRKDYNSIDFYTEDEGEGIPLGKEIDFNYNGIPDYTEGFYAIDSYSPVFLTGEDKNYNGILDDYEFSDKPDYGLDANQKGNEIYIWFSPSPAFEFQIGRYFTKEYDDSHKIQSFYLKSLYETLISKIFYLNVYNKISYIEKDLWVVDKGLLDGIDNDLDGSVDEPDEIESVISNTGIYERSLISRSVLKFLMKRLKGGLGTKFLIGHYYVNNFKSDKKYSYIGSSGLIDLKKEFYNFIVRPFYKLTSINISESPFNLCSYYSSYILRCYGIICGYRLIKDWKLKSGYLIQKYNFNLNSNDSKKKIFLIELIGKPLLGGRVMVSKFGFEKIILRNKEGENKQANFFLKLYFRM